MTPADLDALARGAHPDPYSVLGPHVVAGHVVTVEDPYRFPPALTEYDLYLLGEGRHHNADERLGAHRRKLDGVVGVAFAVWAPNAQRVSVVGDFNAWDGRVHVM